MRVGTATMYNLGTGSLLAQQSEMVKTQQQMASGRRMVSSGDDPAAAASALRTAQSLARNQRLQENQDAAMTSLAVAESALGSVADVILAIQDRLVQAQNQALSAAERGIVASDIESMLDQLVGLGNTRDANGAYLFGGFSEATIPFVTTTAGVVYQGDDGERKLELAPGREVAISAPGSDVFMRTRSGNGVFATAAAAGNTGGGFIDAGSVADPAALDGHAYRLTFNVGGAGTTYDLYDLTAGATVSSGVPYRPGQATIVAGMQFTISGNPANGDVFTAQPSVNQSAFKVVADAIAALRGGGPDAVRWSTVNTARASLAQVADRASAARSEFGARLAEIDLHRNVSGAVVLEHQKRLSELQDVDYTEAASRLMRQQTATEAAQQSFAKLAKLSLFNYLG
ncbi:MAG: flagellar hook-associated protein FlgL [Burkholderiales bacterium]|nr:flagellar hook-associated protein FlgL [Burkholderiales bacterium]